MNDPQTGDCLARTYVRYTLTHGVAVALSALRGARGSGCSAQGHGRVLLGTVAGGSTSAWPICLARVGAARPTRSGTTVHARTRCAGIILTLRVACARHNARPS